MESGLIATIAVILVPRILVGIPGMNPIRTVVAAVAVPRVLSVPG